MSNKPQYLRGFFPIRRLMGPVLILIIDKTICNIMVITFICSLDNNALISMQHCAIYDKVLYIKRMQNSRIWNSVKITVYNSSPFLCFKNSDQQRSS